MVEGELGGVAGVGPGAPEGCWGLAVCVGVGTLEEALGGWERVEGRGVEYAVTAAARAGLTRAGERMPGLGRRRGGRLVVAVEVICGAAHAEGRRAPSSTEDRQAE